MSDRIQLMLSQNALNSFRWAANEIVRASKAHPEEYAKERHAHVVWLITALEVIEATLMRGETTVNLIHA